MVNKFNLHLERLSNSISIEINKFFLSKLKTMGVSNNDTINEYKDEINLFIYFLHKSSEKINNSLINESKSVFKLNYTTTNFIFCFLIKPDKSCSFDFKLIKSAIKNFPPSFLTKRIKPIVGYVYIIKSQYGYKIGKTKNITNRMSDFSILLPFKFEIHSIVKCKEFTELELILHRCLNHKRLNGEWFDLIDDDFTEMDIILKNMKLKRENYNLSLEVSNG